MKSHLIVNSNRGEDINWYGEFWSREAGGARGSLNTTHTARPSGVQRTLSATVSMNLTAEDDYCGEKGIQELELSSEGGVLWLSSQKFLTLHCTEKSALNGDYVSVLATPFIPRI